MSKTIVFIHGMFLNPKSWRAWQDFFEGRGYETVAPAWPLHDGEPAQLRANLPAGIGTLSLDAVVDAMAAAASRHDDPILVGHSVGGLVVQILASRGIGSAGVPICSVAPNRMLSLDWGFFRNSAAITNPLKGDAPYPMDADGFHQNFANTMTRSESDAAYERFALSESRNVLRDCMGDLGKIDVERPHTPLLFIGAEKDEIVPAALCQRNAKAYTDGDSRADYVEFSGRGHFICGEPGWEEVAGKVADWLQEVGASQASRDPAVRGV
jgi:pimeloyl-ACP methyl ester carboxylesterase